MKFTLPWLKEHLETEADAATVAATLTRLGLEVDGIEPRGQLDGFIVGHIVRHRPHPNADKLNLCTVEIGEDHPVEVVCGAPNVRDGLIGIYAPIGAYIPGSDFTLKKAKIRGVESVGMLCSARELQLSDEHEGIIDLAGHIDAAPGTPAQAVLAVEGPVIDIDLTPDRADCFGISGIARDLAAAGLGTWRARDMRPVDNLAGPSPLKVTLDFPEGQQDACPLFAARVIKGVKNGPSPAWLQDRLRAIGLRPISTLVDITNLVTFDLNRPLHVFDAAKVQGDLLLRFAQPGEDLRALDGKSYELQDGMTVIADASGAISLGGIMGGESTGVQDDTVDVILEIALFDAVRTRRTGNALNIISDARTRFERGVDPVQALPAVEYATRLILDLCGGEACEAFIAGGAPGPRNAFELPVALLARIGGISLSAAEIVAHLHALGFAFDQPTPDDMAAIEAGTFTLTLTPPPWRHDITMAYDVVEELVRLHGYDKIPPVPVRRVESVGTPLLTLEQTRQSEIRRTLAAQGLCEAITWSFLQPEAAAAFGGHHVALVNPLNAELSVLRPSLLPNLVLAAGRNRARGVERGGLFEIGPAFTATSDAQTSIAAGLRFGDAAPRHWAEAARPVDAIDVKGDVMAALEALGVKTEALQLSRATPGWYHPGRSGVVQMGPGNVLAYFGELHPQALRALDVAGPVVGFELFLEAIPKPKPRTSRAKPALNASLYPAVERDFAFVVADSVRADEVARAVKTAEKNLIRAVEVFDIYAGKGIEDGHKSIAVAVRLQADDRTLTEDEIEPVSAKITASVTKATGAVLRQ